MAKTAEVTVADTRTDREIVLEALRTGGTLIDWGAHVDFIPGSSNLIEPEFLEGVPFAILGGTYREGFTREIRGQKIKGDYASLEIMIGDEDILRTRGVDISTKPFTALEMGRLNDGSTGIRRQITGHLVRNGYIRVSTTPIEEIVEGGKLGHSDFDIPVGFWEGCDKGEHSTTEAGNHVYDFHLDRLIVCPRGLRKSEYVNEEVDEKKTITTWYLT